MDERIKAGLFQKDNDSDSLVVDIFWLIDQNSKEERPCPNNQVFLKNSMVA